MKLNKKSNLSALTEEEQRRINGGAPDEDTGFWYDVAYFTVVGIMMPDHSDVPGAF